MTAQEKADAINKMQANPSFHPLTCGNPKRTETHVLVAEVSADSGLELVCPVCGWRQDYLPMLPYEAMADYRFFS